jgi:hypothetical protein
MNTYKTVISIVLLLLLFFVGLSAVVPARASFDLPRVAYYDDVKRVLNLTSEQEAMLETNGFVVVEISNPSDMGLNPALRFEDFYYDKVYRNDLPVFVTTDSILHLFHVIFDCSLRILENEAFYPIIVEVTQYAFNSSLKDYFAIAHDGSLKYWAIRNSTVYFAVALSLITGETVALPSELLGDEAFYLDQIYAEDPQFLLAGRWHIPEAPYSVEVKYDFTQFKVRGHYLGEVNLERYFRTLMWYGNYPIFIPRNDEQYEWFLRHIDDAAIVYIRDILKANPQYYEKWMLLYNVTSNLVGESDSINPLNLETALHVVFGDSERYLDLVAAEGGLAALREELSKPEYQQRILSQALIAQMLAPLPRYPTVFQFMGQRYVPDSFIFQILCWDKVGYNSEGERRIMPKGPDVFAVLGSERAYQLLMPDFDFENYTRNLSILRENFNNLTEEDWAHSSYMTWIHALQSIVNVEYGENYPDFMRTLSWQDEKLNTGLGSWAQLRHDTLLYAKQTYIPGWFCSYPEAFVEPNPTFYSRMQELSERTIKAVNILPSKEVNPAITTSLETIKNVTQKLKVISEKELTKEPLTLEEVEFIKKLAWNCGSGGFIGWYVDTIHNIAMAANYTSLLEVPVIADVATFPPGDMQYPPQILHVGVGYVNALVVLYPKLNGTLVAAVGPVFSYYEFRLIGTKRLNDLEWKNMLGWDNRTKYLPEWLKDVYGMGEPWAVPEYPNAVAVLIAVITATSAIVTFKKIARALLNRKRGEFARDIVTTHGKSQSASSCVESFRMHPLVVF